MRKIALPHNAKYPPIAKNGQIDTYNGVWEMTPLSWLKKLPGNTLRNPIADLMQEIQQDGIRSPVIINVGKNSRTAKLGEGNHRIAALDALGYTHAPARCIVGREYGKGGPDMDKDLIPVADEYFPADAKPSAVFRSLAVAN